MHLALSALYLLVLSRAARALPAPAIVCARGACAVVTAGQDGEPELCFLDSCYKLVRGEAQWCFMGHACEAEQL